MGNGNVRRIAAEGEASSSKGKKGQKPPIYPSIWERIPLGVYVFAISAVILALGIGVPTYVGQLHMSSSMPKPSETAVVGGAAPGFSLKDAYGRTYTLAPGDGKNHLLVFYMGYF